MFSPHKSCPKSWKAEWWHTRYEGKLAKNLCLFDFSYDQNSLSWKVEYRVKFEIVIIHRDIKHRSNFVHSYSLIWADFYRTLYPLDRIEVNVWILSFTKLNLYFQFRPIHVLSMPYSTSTSCACTMRSLGILLHVRSYNFCHAGKPYETHFMKI